MDIPGSIGAPAPTYLKDMDPSAQKDIKNMSMGERLNQMGGIQTDKNLYEDKTKMGKDAFLKMFMEQLKNQDPLSPVKNEQFSQQMAMFSQLEQQIATNKNLEKMISQQNNTQIAALQLVGKTILADRAAIYHDKDKASALSFKLPQDVSELKLEIQDQAGETIKTYNLGARPQGDVAWKWDGFKETGQSAESGKYVYKVSGRGMDNKEIKINTKIDGRVDGVTSSQGTTFLLVGDQRVGLNDVEVIKESPAAQSAQGGSVQAQIPAGFNALPAGMANNIANSLGHEGSKNMADANGEENQPGNAKSESTPPPSGEVASPKVDSNSEALQDVIQGDRLNPLLPLYGR